MSHFDSLTASLEARIAALTAAGRHAAANQLRLQHDLLHGK